MQCRFQWWTLIAPCDSRETNSLVGHFFVLQTGGITPEHEYSNIAASRNTEAK
jgi:hypothetical protein